MGDDEGDAGLIIIFPKSDRLYTNVKLTLMKEERKLRCLSIKGGGFTDFGFFEQSRGRCRGRSWGCRLRSASFILKGGKTVSKELILVAEGLILCTEGLNLIMEGSKGFSLCHDMMK